MLHWTDIDRHFLPVLSMRIETRSPAVRKNEAVMTSSAVAIFTPPIFDTISPP
jgi:hypothetical protein